MKGIIFKDFYLSFGLKKNLFSFLFGIAVMMIIIFFAKNMFGLILISGVLVPVISTSLIQISVEEDEKCDFNKIQLTYPMTKNEIILSKYKGGLIFLGMTVIFNFILIMIYVYLFKSITMVNALYILLVGFVFGLILLALSSFIFILLGNKKGLVIYIIMIMLISMSYGFASWNIDYMSLIVNNTLAIIGIGFLLGIVSLFISYKASLYVYKKRYS